MITRLWRPKAIKVTVLLTLPLAKPYRAAVVLLQIARLDTVQLVALRASLQVLVRLASANVTGTVLCTPLASLHKVVGAGKTIRAVSVKVLALVNLLIKGAWCVVELVQAAFPHPAHPNQAARQA